MRPSRLALALLLPLLAPAAEPPRDAERLVAAVLSETPLVADLRSLTDEIGGRATGSEANLRSVDWGLARFQKAGVAARKEPFTMPARWLERSATATVSGDVSFRPRVVAMPFSAPASSGVRAVLVDGGTGSEADFTRLGETARSAFVVVETPELLDLDGLFREYNEATLVEKRALAAGVRGVVYMSSRPRNLEYRHNASLGTENKSPMLVMDREDAQRTLRLLRDGKKLVLTAFLDLDTGGAYESFNVVGEIRGSERPEEIVLIGAHLDSWDLGTGALDNGCNVALVLDVARQIQALGKRPRRTIRFVLWNGEEQGMIGSWGYAKTHARELDSHVLTMAFDIGSGRINGFFTNGRPELIQDVDRALAPVQGLGPFQQVNEPIVGTDNFDFMMEGVPNLVANQESSNYGPNYHARSDTFDKVDLRQLRLNAAVAAAVTWAFADGTSSYRRQSREEIQKLIDGSSLKGQLESFGLLQAWENGTRGRKK